MSYQTIESLWDTAKQIEATEWFKTVLYGEYGTTVWTDADYNRVDPTDGTVPVWTAMLRPSRDGGSPCEIFVLHQYERQIKDINHILAP